MGSQETTHVQKPWMCNHAVAVQSTNKLIASSHGIHKCMLDIHEC